MTRRAAATSATLTRPAGTVRIPEDAEVVRCPRCGADAIKAGQQQLDPSTVAIVGWQHYARLHVCAAAAAAPPVTQPAPSAALQRVIDRSASGHAPDGTLRICAAWRYGHRDLTREAQIRASGRVAGQPVEISAEERAEAAELHRRLYGDEQ